MRAFYKSPRRDEWEELRRPFAANILKMWRKTSRPQRTYYPSQRIYEYVGRRGTYQLAISANEPKSPIVFKVRSLPHHWRIS